MLGYGETESSRRVEDYSYRSVAYDLSSLLDQCGVKGQVVVVGHDWGGMGTCAEPSLERAPR